MEIKSIQKYVIISPTKLRQVARLIFKISPLKAVDTLPHIGKKAGEPLLKVIKTALANAKDKGVSQDALVFKEIQINDGPRLKRGNQVSRGRWHPYVKKMSHIRVILKSVEKKIAVRPDIANIDKKPKNINAGSELNKDKMTKTKKEKK